LVDLLPGQERSDRRGKRIISKRDILEGEPSGGSILNQKRGGAVWDRVDGGTREEKHGLRPGPAQNYLAPWGEVPKRGGEEWTFDSRKSGNASEARGKGTTEDSSNEGKRSGEIAKKDLEKKRANPEQSMCPMNGEASGITNERRNK